jgi:uncharacterized protein
MTDVLLLALLTLTASGVGTLSGFGTSTIMVPVLTLFFPLPVTLLFVAIIHLFGDIWKMLLFRRGIEWRVILAFGIPGVALSFVGANLSVGVDTALLERLLGGFLLAYVAFLFFQRGWKLPRTTAFAATGGALSGFFAGIFGVGGAIRGTFLTAFDLAKATYIFTSGAIAFLIDTARLGTYLAQGVRLEPLMLYGMLAFIPASFAGAFLAKKVVDRIPQRAFRLVIAGVLGVLGVRYLVFPGS